MADTATQFIDDIPVGVRAAGFPELSAMLHSQRELRSDWVANVGRIRSTGGRIVIADAIEATITEDGVSPARDAVLRPYGAFDGGLSYVLGVPLVYMRKLRESADVEAVLDLADATVNTWLDQLPRDRKLLIRAFTNDSGHGIARAIMSNGYAAIDNLDLLVATLKGFHEAGMGPDQLEVRGDITDTRMFVRFTAPEIRTRAAELLDGYRYHGRDASEFPWVFAGLELSNSETGGGTAKLTPRFEVQVCSNGMKATKYSVKSTHIGARLDEGVVNWSGETQGKALALATSQAADTVRKFMTVEFMDEVIAEVTGHARTPVVKETVERVARAGGFSESETERVMDEWLMGGQLTAGGVLQAVTAVAQGVDDANRAAELEDAAMDLMVAAASAR